VSEGSQENWRFARESVDAERFSGAFAGAGVAVGNLLGAIPAAALIDMYIRWRTGHSFLAHAAALHGVESMHPSRSLTIPFAALTGCFLWLSSLVAGWTAK